LHLRHVRSTIASTIAFIIKSDESEEEPCEY
jgi:hypothetical protein